MGNHKGSLLYRVGNAKPITTGAAGNMLLNKCTPAMAAGLTDHKWEIEELLATI